MNLPLSTPVFSIVVAVMNEAGNILPLAQGIAATMSQPQITALGDYELIFIDDASRDTTVAEIIQAKAHNPRVRLIRYAENRGKSRAQWVGIDAARGQWIVTIDGDMQNPPEEIAKLIGALPNLKDEMIVAGLRQKRMDTASKRYASKYANRIRIWALGDDCPDAGCGVRLFPRAAYLRLPYFDNMHRYYTTLFKLYQLPVAYVKIEDRPRTIGVSKYTNWQRGLVGIVDLIGVRWLQARTHVIKAWEE